MSAADVASRPRMTLDEARRRVEWIATYLGGTGKWPDPTLLDAPALRMVLARAMGATEDAT